MINRFLVAAVALFAVLATANNASAAGCTSATEREAFYVRSLQTDLMVAGIICKTQAQYNDFVTRFKPALKKQGGVLKARFKKAYGGKAAREMDKYVTDLANRASLRSMKSRENFCARVKTTISGLQSQKPSGLAAFTMANAVEGADVPDSCRASVKMVKKSQ